jgi:hypothetical protein
MQIIVKVISFGGYEHNVIVQNWRHARSVMRRAKSTISVSKNKRRWPSYLSHRMYKKLKKMLKTRE